MIKSLFIRDEGKTFEFKENCRSLMKIVQNSMSSGARKSALKLSPSELLPSSFHQYPGNLPLKEGKSRISPFLMMAI